MSLSQSPSLILVRYLVLWTTWTFLKFLLPWLGFQFSSPFKFLFCLHSCSSLPFTDTSFHHYHRQLWFCLPSWLCTHSYLGTSLHLSGTCQTWCTPLIAGVRPLLLQIILKRISHFLFFAYIQVPNVWTSIGHLPPKFSILSRHHFSSRADTYSHRLITLSKSFRLLVSVSLHYSQRSLGQGISNISCNPKDVILIHFQIWSDLYLKKHISFYPTL